jgi:hypothetical protein
MDQTEKGPCSHKLGDSAVRVSRDGFTAEGAIVSVSGIAVAMRKNKLQANILAYLLIDDVEDLPQRRIV